VAQVSHREKLIDGAIRCLHANGYAGTSARAIAAESGASLASIGYHFGSKDTLLAKALLRSFGEWVSRIGEITVAVEDASPAQRAATALAAARESFEAQQPLLIAFVEAMAQARRSEELREEMAALYREGRREVAEIVRTSFGEHAATLRSDPEVIASLVIATIDGLALQWLLDPNEVASGDELASVLADMIAPAVDAGPSTGRA
jgi:AcrR family transcriptional regulator